MMIIRVKLYASLGKYLPEGSVRNEIDQTVSEGATVTEILSGLNVPGEMCHLVLVNGNYLAPGERDECALKEGDHLAVWPPVAGG